MKSITEPWVLCPRGNKSTNNLPIRFWERDIRCNGKMIATTHGATEEEAEAIAREIVSLKSQLESFSIALERIRLRETDGDPLNAPSMCRLIATETLAKYKTS